MVLDLASRDGVASQDSLIVLIQVLSFDSLDLGREVLPSAVDKELLVSPRGVRKCTLCPGPLTFGVVYGDLGGAEVGGLLQVLQSVFLVGSLCLDFSVGCQRNNELWRWTLQDSHIPETKAAPAKSAADTGMNMMKGERRQTKARGL